MTLYINNFVPSPVFHILYHAGKILEVEIIKKSHSQLKIESRERRFFCMKDFVCSYGGLMIRESIKHVLHERNCFLWLSRSIPGPVEPVDTI
jgi:hypothetical protein